MMETENSGHISTQQKQSCLQSVDLADNFHALSLTDSLEFAYKFQ